GGGVLPGLPAAVHRPDGSCATEVPAAHWHPLCRGHVVVGGGVPGGGSDATGFLAVPGPSMAGRGGCGAVRRFWGGGRARPSVVQNQEGAASRGQRGSTEPRTAPDCLQPPLVPRCGFRQQVSASVRLHV